MMQDEPVLPGAPQTHHEVERRMEALDRQFSDLQRQIQRMQRLASLGTVSTILAHEFNNQLTPIVTHCQYALTHDEPAMMRGALDKTLRSARRLATLCERIMGMATDNSMGASNTAVEPLITEAVECLGRDLEKDDISLTISVPAGLQVRARPAALQQVLFNLLLNARQALSGGPGRLSVSAEAAVNQTVRIEVRDSGPGISPENLERIFEPFFSTKSGESRPDRGGLGLGLHICRQLMAEQNGDISVSSKPGQGAAFILTLPAAE